MESEAIVAIVETIVTGIVILGIFIFLYHSTK